MAVVALRLIQSSTECEQSSVGEALVKRDLCLLGDIRPFTPLGGEKRREFLRRTNPRLRAEPDEQLLHVWGGKRVIDRAVELTDDGGRRAGGRRKPRPQQAGGPPLPPPPHGPPNAAS